MFKNDEQRTRTIQIGLFIITLIVTTFAGAEWMTGRFLLYGENPINSQELINGLQFSLPFLFILTVHEFGHYFTAQYHKVRVTLPFYIPLWLGWIIGFPSIGTMGAFIRIKEIIDSRKKYFDIGVAGPLAGFVAALFVLIYAFSNLPERESVYKIHPEYEEFGLNYAEHVYDYEYFEYRHYELYVKDRAQDSLAHLQEYESIDTWGYPTFEALPSYQISYLGNNLLFEILEYWLVDDPNTVPNQFEMMHYPFLFAGFLALFFTSLNLLPIGQLDGGHILYGLIGPKRNRRVSQMMFVGLLYYAGLGLTNPDLMIQSPLLQLMYFGYLYLCFYKFTPKVRDRVMYALGIFTAQMATTLIYPQIQGNWTWLLFGFILGRVLGIYHPPVLIDQPLDLKRKVIGWISLVVFILSFSPRPLDVKTVYRSEVRSETPTILSAINPSPYFTRMDIPHSLPLASNKAINSGVEISVLEDSPLGSKN